MAGNNANFVVKMTVILRRTYITYIKQVTHFTDSAEILFRDLYVEITLFLVSAEKMR